MLLLGVVLLVVLLVERRELCESYLSLFEHSLLLLHRCSAPLLSVDDGRAVFALHATALAAGESLVRIIYPLSIRFGSLLLHFRQGRDRTMCYQRMVGANVSNLVHVDSLALALALLVGVIVDLEEHEAADRKEICCSALPSRQVVRAACEDSVDLFTAKLVWLA